MANTMRLMDKTTLTYAAVDLPATKSSIIPVALNVDVSMYKELVLLLRVHSLVGGAGVLVKAEMANSAPTSEDPATVFRGTTLGSVATLAWAQPQISFLATGVASAGVGSHVDCILTVTQGNPAVAITAVVSIDLVGKTG